MNQSTDDVNDASATRERLAALVDEIDAAAWLRFVEQLAQEALPHAKALVDIVRRADDRVRASRPLLHEQRALARELGSRPLRSTPFERGLQAVIGHVARYLRAELIRGGADRWHLELLGDITSPEIVANAATSPRAAANKVTTTDDPRKER